jgi:hypothetical protein
MCRKIGVGLEVALLLIVHLRPERMPERLRCPFSECLPKELWALEMQCTQDFSFTGPVLLGWTCPGARTATASPCAGETSAQIASPAGVLGGDVLAEQRQASRALSTAIWRDEMCGGAVTPVIARYSIVLQMLPGSVSRL